LLVQTTQENLAFLGQSTSYLTLTGDSNLGGAALRDIAEMAGVGSTKPAIRRPFMILSEG